MNKQLIIAKFGGTSVANTNSIKHCIEIIKNSPQTKIVVVSAQSGVTNLLVQLATQCNTKDSITQIIEEIKNITKPILQNINDLETSIKIDNILEDINLLAEMSLRLKTPQLSDEILSFGEFISATLMTQSLKNSGLPALHLSAKNIIKTDSHFGQAKALTSEIRTHAQQHLLPLIEENIVILEGFIGSDSFGQTTTLGRGGSDYSAALIAEAIQASALHIWTDVPGIYQVDPRVIEESTSIEKITFNEAAELATFGAKIIHPSTLWPAIHNNIDIFIGSTFNPTIAGTWISKENQQNPPVIRAIAERKNQVLLTIKSYDMVHAQGFLAKVFNILAQHKVSVDLVTTSEISVALTLDHIGSQSIGNTLLTPSLLNELNEIGNVEVKIDRDLSLIAIVGNDIHQTKNISARVFSELTEYNIRLFSHGASGHNICLLVDKNDAPKIIRKIYDQFFNLKRSSI